MERILAVLNRTETAPCVLHVAQGIASRLGKVQISALHPRLSQDPSFMPSEEVMTEERSRIFAHGSAEHATHLRRLFEQWTATLGDGCTTRWIEIIGDPATSVGSDALPDDPDNVRLAFKAALYDADACVVVAPGQMAATIGAHPAVAWAPSDAVDKAIDGAMPLLLSADRVTILIAQEGRIDTREPEPLLRTLEQARLATDVVRFHLQGEDIGAALLSRAQSAGADLLVMGAYTHNRFMEALLGGATREALAHASIALLMHH
jgi:nucleotide-binding universal stress UspA family protein